MSTAYDTSNDELLRKGTFDFNNIGNTTANHIKNSPNETQRIHTFIRDDKVNEFTINIENIKCPLVAAKRYQITKIDADDQWYEKYVIIVMCQRPTCKEVI